MFAFFHSLGNDSVSRQFLKIRCNGFDIEEAQSFIIRIEISSWPCALFWSNDLIILTISSTQNSKDECLSLVTKFIPAGTVLSFRYRSALFSRNYWIDWPYPKNQLQVCYLLVMVVSVESYCHLQMFSRWPNMFWELFSILLARRSWYFNLEELIAFWFPHLSKVGLCRHIK